MITKHNTDQHSTLGYLAIVSSVDEIPTDGNHIDLAPFQLISSNNQIFQKISQNYFWSNWKKINVLPDKLLFEI